MWTLDTIKGLVSSGKLQGYTISGSKIQKNLIGKIVTKHFKQKSKEKDWLVWNLTIFCLEHGYTLYQEYKFNPDRKWKADFAIIQMKVLLEYEGVFSEKSRHTTAKGYTGDTEKYNSAQALGWRVLRFTAINYKNLLIELKKLK